MPAKSTAKTRPETVKKGHKWCPRCGEVKVHDLFARNRASKDGLFSICKDCERLDRIAAKERRAAAAAEAAKAAKPKRTRKAPTA